MSLNKELVRPAVLCLMLAFAPSVVGAASMSIQDNGRIPMGGGVCFSPVDHTYPNGWTTLQEPVCASKEFPTFPVRGSSQKPGSSVLPQGR